MVVCHTLQESHGTDAMAHTLRPAILVLQWLHRSSLWQLELARAVVCDIGQTANTAHTCLHQVLARPATGPKYTMRWAGWT